MKTTVDYLRVLKEPDDAHYDMVFSVMQGQQQLDLLPVLKSVDTDLIVLVGNNLETDKCEEALKDMNHLYGFQGSAGHREGGVTVAGRLPTTDMMPNAYRIAQKWNISDHDKRVKDGSLTYDYFNVSEGKIEYSISGCVYIEMFEQYGIRSLCKIFCMTDTTSYENLPKHVKFVRHSDLSDGDCCHDEIFDRKHLRN